MLHRRLKARVDMDNFYFFLFFLVSLPCITADAGTVSSRCEAAGASSETKYTLRCQFPVNVNTTRRDFSLYFDAGDGKADRFLDCRWPDGSHFYCFNLEGVTCLQPVSNEAYVTVPGRIACSSGRLSAKILGSGDVRDTVCRYLTLPDDQVNLKPPPTDPPETSPKAEASSSATVIAIVVTVLTGVLLAVAAVFVVRYRKEIKCRLKQLTSGKQQEQPEKRDYSSVSVNDVI